MIMTRHRVSNGSLMRTEMEDGTETTGNGSKMSYLDPAMSSLMSVVPYYGPANYRKQLL